MKQAVLRADLKRYDTTKTNQEKDEEHLASMIEDMHTGGNKKDVDSKTTAASAASRMNASKKKLNVRNSGRVTCE